MFHNKYKKINLLCIWIFIFYARSSRTVIPKQLPVTARGFKGEEIATARCIVPHLVYSPYVVLANSSRHRHRQSDDSASVLQEVHHHRCMQSVVLTVGGLSRTVGADCI